MSKTADIRPVFFWFSSNAEGSQQSAVVYCAPQLSLHNVTITVNLANGSLIDIIPTGDYDAPSDLTNGGPPLNGGIWNGVDFNLTNPSAVVLQRANTTRQQLPASVFVAAQLSPNGLSSVFNNQSAWADLTTTYYVSVLSGVISNGGLIRCSARSWHFRGGPTISSRIRQGLTCLRTLRRSRRGYGSGTQGSIIIFSCSYHVFIQSPIAVHILAVVLIVSGIVGMFIHYLHYQLRKGVKLYAQPGTIASAASITADSGLNSLVKPGFTGEQLRKALRGHKFTVDNTGRVVLQDENGLESARPVPLEKRGSVYGQLMRAAR